MSLYSKSLPETMLTLFLIFGQLKPHYSFRKSCSYYEACNFNISGNQQRLSITPAVCLQNGLPDLIT